MVAARLVEYYASALWRRSSGGVKPASRRLGHVVAGIREGMVDEFEEHLGRTLSKNGGPYP